MLKRLIPAAILAATLALPARAEPFRMIVTDMEVPLVPNSVMELAAQEGYFDRAGVDVEFVRVQQTPLGDGRPSRRRGRDGQRRARGRCSRRPPRAPPTCAAVMSPNTSLPYLIAGKGDIKALPDLAGKRFGIGRVGSVDHLLSTKVLEAAGVDTSRIQFVALGQPQQRAQALVAGQIDATTMSIGTWTAIDDTPGLAVLVDVDAYYRAAPILSKLNIVRADTLADRGQDVEAVIEAITLASRDFAAHPDHWVAAMQQGPARRAGGRPRAPRQGLRRHLEHRRRHLPRRAAGGPGLAAAERGLRRREARPARRLGRLRPARRTCSRRSARPRPATCPPADPPLSAAAHLSPRRRRAQPRRPAGARRHRPRRKPRRDRGAARPVRLRQDLAPPARRGPPPPRRRPHPGERRPSRPRPGGGDGLPVLPAPALEDRPRQRRLRASRTSPSPSAPPAPTASSPRSASPASPTPGRASSPAACSSAPPSPAPSPPSPSSC